MASQRPSQSYDEKTLVALEQALRDVWEVLKAHHPSHDWDFLAQGRDGVRTMARRTSIAKAQPAVAAGNIRAAILFSRGRM